MICSMVQQFVELSKCKVIARLFIVKILHLVQVFPEILSHQSEGTEEGIWEIVKTCVAIVGIGTVA